MQSEWKKVPDSDIFSCIFCFICLDLEKCIEKIWGFEFKKIQLWWTKMGGFFSFALPLLHNFFSTDFSLFISNLISGSIHKLVARIDP